MIPQITLCFCTDTSSVVLFLDTFFAESALLALLRAPVMLCLLGSAFAFVYVRSFRFVTLESRNRIVAVLLVGFCIAVGLVTEVSPSDLVSGVFATCDAFSHSQSPFPHGAGQDAHNGELWASNADLAVNAL